MLPKEINHFESNLKKTTLIIQKTRLNCMIITAHSITTFSNLFSLYSAHQHSNLNVSKNILMIE